MPDRSALRLVSMLAPALALGLAGCEPEQLTQPRGGTDAPAAITVEAVHGWAFLELGEEARPVAVTDATSSTAWDIAFFATSVMLNGGDAGPAGVVGYCVCGNAALTDAQVGALTAASELGDFEAVTAADIPASVDAWQSDALAPAISGWYAYDAVAHEVSVVPGKVWKIRTAEAEAPAYAKLRVTGIAGATQADAGSITIEFAVQPARGAAMGAVQGATVDVSGGARVHFDLVQGAVSDASDWDLLFEGYTIRVNGGASGSGGAGAIVVDEPFAAITDASDMTTHYRGDAYGGAFAAQPWYRYNITGEDHQIWPTFDVYLVKRGSAVYKVQLISYYDPASAESRYITLRYARLAS